MHQNHFGGNTSNGTTNGSSVDSSGSPGFNGDYQTLQDNDSYGNSTGFNNGSTFNPSTTVTPGQNGSHHKFHPHTTQNLGDNSNGTSMPGTNGHQYNLHHHANGNSVPLTSNNLHRPNGNQTNLHNQQNGSMHGSHSMGSSNANYGQMPNDYSGGRPSTDTTTPGQTSNDCVGQMCPTNNFGTNQPGPSYTDTTTPGQISNGCVGKLCPDTSSSNGTNYSGMSNNHSGAMNSLGGSPTDSGTSGPWSGNCVGKLCPDSNSSSPIGTSTSSAYGSSVDTSTSNGLSTQIQQQQGYNPLDQPSNGIPTNDDPMTHHTLSSSETSSSDTSSSEIENNENNTKIQIIRPDGQPMHPVARLIHGLIFASMIQKMAEKQKEAAELHKNGQITGMTSNDSSLDGQTTSPKTDGDGIFGHQTEHIESNRNHHAIQVSMKQSSQKHSTESTKSTKSTVHKMTIHPRPNRPSSRTN